MRPHEHWDEARLLEALLAAPVRGDRIERDRIEPDRIEREPGQAGAHAADALDLEGCALCHAAALELEGFLEQCRDAAAAEEPGPARSAAQVARVLARTTGEDLGLGGDLSLLARFARDRLADSPLLRVAAACLLVNLTALPLLAWLAISQPRAERSFRAYFETREQALPAVPEEPEWELESPAVPEPAPLDQTHDEQAPGGRSSTSAVAAERAHLLRVGAPRGWGDGASPAQAEALGESPVWGLLSLRAARLSGAVGPQAVASARLSKAPDALAQVLWVELLLDHLVLAGERLPALDAGLTRLEALPDATGSGAPTELRGALSELRGLTLARATRLGLRPAPPPGFGPGELDERGFGEVLLEALPAELAERAGAWGDWDR